MMAKWTILTGALLGSFVIGATAQDGGDLAARVAKLDERVLRALGELAALFDSKKDPEATHFLCECAIGFGSKDAALADLKKKWEDEVYCGRVRGGVVLADAKPITEKLGAIAKEYGVVFAESAATAEKRAPHSEGGRRAAGRGLAPSSPFRAKAT
jgi:hypothetical protein